MRQLLDFLVKAPRRLFILLLRGYQTFISPHTLPTCRFHPTCSTYSIEAFREYGAVKGLILTVYRLSRCHPWGGHGYDPPRWFGQPLPEKYRIQTPTADSPTADSTVSDDAAVADRVDSPAEPAASDRS